MPTHTPSDPSILEPVADAAATRALLDEVHRIEADTEASLFERRQRAARLLGARHDPDTGLTSFGFWAPEISASRIEAHAVTLELFTPLEPIDFRSARVAGNFRRTRIALEPVGDWWWVVVSGVVAGNRDRAGAMYRLRAQTGQSGLGGTGQHDRARRPRAGTGGDGTELIRRDLVADSLPWGAFAPAEVYDVVSMQRERRDLGHFARTPAPPATILELHVPTATAGRHDRGSRRGVPRARRQAALGRAARRRPRPSTRATRPSSRCPVDPTIERPAEVATFTITDTVDELAGIVGVLLRPSRTT